MGLGSTFHSFKCRRKSLELITIRIYNPVKQSEEKDSDATFILEWVPELKSLPIHPVHRPWEMNPMEALWIDFKLGRDYPRPIVPLEESAQKARKHLWETKEGQRMRRT